MSEIIVSVIVVTYNSEKYILDTLESIYKQTYKMIELIVSDDCSCDNTVECVNEWLRIYGSRFWKAKILTSEKNCGIPFNCNKGIKNASGKYIKLLGGDDLLCERTVEHLLEKSVIYPNKVIISKVEPFGDYEGARKMIAFCENGYKIISRGNPKLCYKELLKDNYIAGPSWGLLEKSVYEKLDYYDERYKFMEDYPFLVKLLRNDYEFILDDFVIAKYRIHSDSVCQGNPRFFGSMCDYFYNEKSKYLLEQKMYYTCWKQFIKWKIYKLQSVYGKNSFRGRLAKLMYLGVPDILIVKILNKIHKVSCTMW